MLMIINIILRGENCEQGLGGRKGGRVSGREGKGGLDYCLMGFDRG